MSAMIEGRWDTSLLDWEDRIMGGRSLVPDFPDLNQEMAEKGMRIMGRLRVPDLIGMPRMRDVMGEWFNDIARAIFGSYDPVTHRRSLREAFLLIPKKNGKSSGGGAIMLTLMIMNERPEAEFVIVAPTIKISQISFKQAADTIRADEALEKIFHIQDHIRRIEHRNTGATMRILAADADTVTGGKQAYTLLDETHVFATKPSASGIILELRGGLAARPDGMFLQITTQSKTPPAGVFKDELETARKIRDGKLKMPRLVVLYELPKSERERWDDPNNLRRVNPSYGQALDPQFIMDGLETARSKGERALMEFASQHANKELGMDLGTGAWAGADQWLARGDASLTLDEIKRRCDVCVAGGDGGGLDDLLALAILGRDRITRQWLHWSHTWAHPIVLERRKEIAPRLLDFAADGHLTISESVGSDVTSLVEVLVDLDEAGLLASIGLDPMGVGSLVDALAERGIEGPDRVIGISQGWTQTNAIKTAERKLADGTLLHGMQPIMAWAVGNAKVEQRSNALVITKQAAGFAKIDPLLAFFNAVSLMSRNPESPFAVQEDTPVRFL